MADNFLMLLSVVSGIGLTLLGLRNLSEALQAVAGQALRKTMVKPSGGVLSGVLPGFISAFLVQSSSIITVMAVGFVASAMLTLAQSIGIFAGASIGTTSTLWIVALVGDFRVPGFGALAIGVVLYFIMRSEKLRYVGLALMGLGLLLTGLYLIAEGFVDAANLPFMAKIKSFFVVDSFASVFKVAVVSALFATLVQSSAAVSALSLILANNGVMSLDAATAVLIGANIGAAPLCWKAAFGGTSVAKRAALQITIFSLLGFVILILSFPLFAAVVKFFGKLFSLPAPWAIMLPLAAIDTLLAICRASVGLLFAPVILKIAENLIKKPTGEEPHLSSLGFVTRFSPVLACDQVLMEVDFMKQSNLELLDCVGKVVSLKTLADKGPERHIRHREKILDNVQKEVTEFLSSLMTKRMPAQVSARARRLLRITDELESVSDECAKILKVVTRLSESGVTLGDSAVADILKLHKRVLALVTYVTSLIRSPRPAFDLSSIADDSTNIRIFARELRLAQIGNVATSSVAVLGVLDIINAYERIRSYYLNCAETLADGKR